jgi:hypothetical protein
MPPERGEGMTGNRDLPACPPPSILDDEEHGQPQQLHIRLPGAVDHAPHGVGVKAKPATRSTSGRALTPTPLSAFVRTYAGKGSKRSQPPSQMGLTAPLLSGMTDGTFIALAHTRGTGRYIRHATVSGRAMDSQRLTDMRRQSCREWRDLPVISFRVAARRGRARQCV